MSRTFIIAEAGVNHNGSMDLARRLVDAAAEAGADAVKFQSFRAADLVTTNAPKAQYQTRAGVIESQHEMLRRLELTDEDHFALIEHCLSAGIEFMSSPFGVESARFLVEACRVRRLKIPSGEIINAPYLLAVARTKCPVILSTGMSSMGDIEQALGVLAFGYLGGIDQDAGAAAFTRAFRSPEGRTRLRENVTLLHCTSEYPAPLHDVNLKVMETMRSAFGLLVGYSDHTVGIAVPIAATALGAVVVEKHFTLDRTMPGPDHQASLEPGELTAMVAGIRAVEQALGSSEKFPTLDEEKTALVARKSLVAKARIRAGETLSGANVAIKRPGSGVSPMAYWDYVGRVASRSYEVDELIDRA